MRAAAAPARASSRPQRRASGLSAPSGGWPDGVRQPDGVPAPTLLGNASLAGTDRRAASPPRAALRLPPRGPSSLALSELSLSGGKCGGELVAHSRAASRVGGGEKPAEPRPFPRAAAAADTTAAAAAGLLPPEANGDPTGGATPAGAAACAAAAAGAPSPMLPPPSLLWLRRMEERRREERPCSEIRWSARRHVDAMDAREEEGLAVAAAERGAGPGAGAAG